VLNRGEQTLLVGLTLICLSPYVVAKYRPTTNRTWIFLVAGFFLATSYMFSIHPKTLLFLPLMLVAVFYLAVASKRAWVGVLLSGWLALIAYESYSFYAGNLMVCTDSPFADSVIKAQSLSPASLFSAPNDFVISGLRDLIHSYVYVKNALFELHYAFEWLPTSQDQKLGWFSSVNDVAITLIFYSTLGYAVFALTKKVRGCFQSGRIGHETTMPLALFIGMFSCAFLLRAKNFYESSLMLPLLLLLVAMLLAGSPRAKQDGRVRPYIFKFLLVAAIASQMNLILTFSAYPFNSWLAGGLVEGQELSTSFFNYDKTRNDVVEAAANCGIVPGEANTHLVVDDSTYFPFKDAYQPYHALAISRALEKSIGDANLMRFLKGKNSAGLITRCDTLSPEIRRLTRQQGNYCCISQQDISRNAIAAPSLGK
jgi:hypothetical protein